MADENTRISISEERLKLALTEMELRLRVYFDEQLKSKADMAQVVENTHKLREMDRGDFSPAHKRAVVEVVEEILDERTDKGWTSRERLFGVLAIVITVVSFSISLYTSASARADTPPVSKVEVPSGS